MFQHRTVFSSNDGVLSATDGYQQRVSLVPPTSTLGKGSINLTAIREADAGWYECRIFFPNRTPSTRPNGTWFHLTVDGKRESERFCVLCGSSSYCFQQMAYKSLPYNDKVKYLRLIKNLIPIGLTDT